MEVHEDSWCSIIESCHPSRVAFLAVVVVSVLFMIGTVLVLVKLLRKWAINDQHKREQWNESDLNSEDNTEEKLESELFVQMIA